jgi:hypothetical protein
MTEEEHDRIYGTNDFQRMSVYSWDFCMKWRMKEGSPNVIMENAVAVMRIAFKVKAKLAQTVPAILKDPYFDYLDTFLSDFFNNLPEIDFTEEKMAEFLDQTNLFIFEYGTSRDLKNGPEEA